MAVLRHEKGIGSTPTCLYGPASCYPSYISLILVFPSPWRRREARAAGAAGRPRGPCVAHQTGELFSNICVVCMSTSCVSVCACLQRLPQGVACRKQGLKKITSLVVDYRSPRSTSFADSIVAPAVLHLFKRYSATCSSRPQISIQLLGAPALLLDSETIDRF